MKSEKRILTAFLLNLIISIFELMGGIYTGSTAIISDSVHDTGDALSVGLSYFLERKAKQQPDKAYTFGYGRYSVLASVITTLILITGSLLAVINAIDKIINPTALNFNGMTVFALFGVAVNLGAALFTHSGEGLNSKAVTLHMLEDVLGWISVLVCSVIIKLTGFTIIDPIMSIIVSVFIFISAARHFKKSIVILLEKAPDGVDIEKIRKELCKIHGITDVHHLHIWTIDGQSNYAAMHIVSDSSFFEIKNIVRHALEKYNITHTIIETEKQGEECASVVCSTSCCRHFCHHH